MTQTCRMPTRSGSTGRSSQDWLKLLLKQTDESFIAIATMDTNDIIALARAGLPAHALKHLSSRMGVANSRLFKMAHIPKATGTRKLSNDSKLSIEESERTLKLMSFIGQVQRMVNESGNPSGFDAAKWTARWLGEGNPALGGATPESYLDTAEGRRLVSQLLSQLQSCAYV